MPSKTMKIMQNLSAGRINMIETNIGTIEVPTLKIAIDGPASAGKTTLAKNLTKTFPIVCVDTGALYRAVAYGILDSGADIYNKKQLEDYLGQIDVFVEFEDGKQHTYFNGFCVDDYIRTNEISQMASKASAISAVREFLLGLQQETAEKYNVVMEGRDIGSVVLPNADIKIFLTATPECRAKRRALELGMDYEVIQNDIAERDKRDSTRAIAPLQIQKDHIVIDTTSLSISEVTQTISNIINLHLGR